MLKQTGVVLALSVVLLTAGCASGQAGDVPSAAAPASAAPITSASASESPSAAADRGDPGSPSAVRLQTELGRVDPRLDDKYSVYDAENVCGYIKSKSSDAVLRKAIDLRMADRAGGDLTKAQLTKIIKILKRDYCPVRLGETS